MHAARYTERVYFETAMIVEDHPLFSDALAITLTSLQAVGQVARVASLAEALEAVSNAPKPDLVILDLNLPDVDGLDGLIRVKQAVGQTPVLVASSITQPRIISAALAAGASGYVPKHSQREVFAEAFAAIAANEVFVPDGIHLPTQISSVEQDDAIRRLGSLTPQQTRILTLICDGLLNKQIAFELSIAEATVKAHVTAIMRKLGVHSRTQAVVVAREARFDSLDR
ncbi:MAG: response regulator transcription factor [Pseudomonadota bacterium]